MHPPPLSNRYTRHWLPGEIIRHGVWRDVRLCLSSRDVEALMAERGVMLTYEAVRYGGRKVGPV
jgi:putative transposase